MVLLLNPKATATIPADQHDPAHRPAAGAHAGQQPTISAGVPFFRIVLARNTDIVLARNTETRETLIL
jgi:hypothetical protein